jgi:hypothetical protein
MATFTAGVRDSPFDCFVSVSISSTSSNVTITPHTTDTSELQQTIQNVVKYYVDDVTIDVNVLLGRDVSPYCVVARVETAIWRLGKRNIQQKIAQQPFQPAITSPPSPAQQVPTTSAGGRGNETSSKAVTTVLPPRSRLYVPGHSPRFLAKCYETDADMV